MKQVVIMSKDDYECLLVKVHDIQREIQCIVPCWSALEIENAADEIAKILEKDEDELRQSD